jgi:hypothetical protein
MAPDFFEPDQPTSVADIAGQPEILTYELHPSAPRRARLSLFQIVCLEGNPEAEPAS